VPPPPLLWFSVVARPPSRAHIPQGRGFPGQHGWQDAGGRPPASQVYFHTPFFNCNTLNTQSIPRKGGLGQHLLRCCQQMAPVCLALAHRDSPKLSHPLTSPLCTSLSPRVRVQEPAPSSLPCTSTTPHMGHGSRIASSSQIIPPASNILLAFVKLHNF